MVETVVQRMACMLRELQRPMPLEQIRGTEGEAAKHYFVAFDELILQQKDAFFLHERHPPPTPR